jgi:hypothetical protein
MEDYTLSAHEINMYTLKDIEETFEEFCVLIKLAADNVIQHIHTKVEDLKDLLRRLDDVDILCPQMLAYLAYEMRLPSGKKISNATYAEINNLMTPIVNLNIFFIEYLQQSSNQTVKDRATEIAEKTIINVNKIIELVKQKPR